MNLFLFRKSKVALNNESMMDYAKGQQASVKPTPPANMLNHNNLEMLTDVLHLLGSIALVTHAVGNLINRLK